MATVAEELSTLLDRLSSHDQQLILEYARRLSQSSAFPHSALPPGTPGEVVAKLRVSLELGEALEHALEDCEQVDVDEH